MILSSEMIERICAHNTPVLCLDTCAVLDIMRDITRPTIHAHDVRAAFSMLEQAEREGVIVTLLAPQVIYELGEHQSSVETESVDAIGKFLEQVERIDEIAAMYGSAGSLHVAHLDGHAGRARTVMDRWVSMSLEPDPPADVTQRAFSRVNLGRTPAASGKQSMKDCVIVETYLDAISSLRSIGFAGRAVFASSNTKDYCASGTRRLSPDIASDFATVALEFAPTLGAAKHLLGV